MNERAATRGADGRPLWHVNEGLSLFAGALGRNARHSHSVPVFLAGLYERFSLRVGEGAWQRCRAAVVPAGLPYEFDMAGAPLAVLYAEPGRLSAGQMHRLVGAARSEQGALVGQSGEVSLLRESYEAQDSASWLSEALEDLAGFAELRARPSIRVSRVSCAVSAGTIWRLAGRTARRLRPACRRRGFSISSRRRWAFRSGATGPGAACARLSPQCSTDAI
ncbi:AraC family transcriptional regulator [Methyloceanibacter methanicus]|uniref:AraC family transcriptional regulator n=1 Tax=Methyloceanibacter methanicus TaxID=1774968 RepID=UPI001FCDD068|nr:AraC family transcriptional regulator [Methyloceanibacter methanicus]